jgi:hypothetical protein
MEELAQFMQESLSDSEIQDVCFYYFPELYENLNVPGITKDQRIREVLAYVRRRNQDEKLVAALKARFPQLMAEAFPDGVGEPAPPPEVAIEWRERFPRPVLIGLGIGLITTLILALVISNVDPPLPPPDPSIPTPTTDVIITDGGPLMVGQTADAEWDATGVATFGFADGPGQFDFVVEADEDSNPILLLFDAIDSETPLFYIDFQQGNVEEWRYVNFGDNRTYRLVVQGRPNGTFFLSVTRSWPQPLGLGDVVDGVLEGANPAVFLLQDAPAQVNVRLEMSDPTRNQPLLFMLDESGEQIGYYDQANDAGEIVVNGFDLPAGEDVRFVVRDQANDGARFTFLVESAE